MGEDVVVEVLPGYNMDMIAGAVLALVNQVYHREHRCIGMVELVSTIKKLLGHVGEERVRSAARLLEHRGFVRIAVGRHGRVVVCPGP